ncbi:MAG: DUF3761 domain-containing protein [Sphingomicrobium sp.]
MVKVLSLVTFAFLAFSAPFPSLIRAPAAAEARSYSSCGSDSYVNSRGHCVHRPVHARSAPAGATAKCGDGTFTFSESRRGTCSHHGGVVQWL